MNTADQLTKKILQKKALIGIIGMGYVGLPLVLRFCEEDYRVLGFDVDSKKVATLKRGKSYLKSIPSSTISQWIRKGHLDVTDNFSLLGKPDCILICVPTPLTEKMEPDLQYIERTTEAIRQNLRKGQLIVLESTTYPGTTEELVLPKLESTGLKVGKDFFLAFSPEREDPGNKRFTTHQIPKVVAGVTSTCQRAVATLYGQIIKKVIPVSSPRVAELTKLLENIYRSVNIALVNELKMLADRMGIDIWEVIEAASTKPFGFSPFYPGPGMGGHCIPIDPYYLSWKAREYDFTTRFIFLAGEINVHVPYYVVAKVQDALNARGKSIKGAKILILGVAYKKDVDDARESPALAIMDLLQNKGAVILYHDPYIAALPPFRKYNFKLKSSRLTKDLLQRIDAAVVVTDHSSIDYSWVVKQAPLVIDTRNVTKNMKQWKKKIVKA
ncbi:MAG TPA: nucleotide sugar dehydrogenase [Thermodesulfobacteriota bacterium]|nr:nucleotide sugar dehydrogenase [Thermodesulfobacteriota bacterium]